MYLTFVNTFLSFSELSYILLSIYVSYWIFTGFLLIGQMFLIVFQKENGGLTPSFENKKG